YAYSCIELFPPPPCEAAASRSVSKVVEPVVQLGRGAGRTHEGWSWWVTQGLH
ncbi:hypothetical protein NHX12_029899, partial [Muraenolepis orangiensis]